MVVAIAYIRRQHLPPLETLDCFAPGIALGHAIGRVGDLAFGPFRGAEVFGWYLVLYSSARFIIEFFRSHEQGLVAGLSLTQWIALGLLVSGTALLTRVRQSRLVEVGGSAH